MLPDLRYFDRRNGSRTAAAGRIAWSRSTNPAILAGWMSDRSNRGLSFIAAQCESPLPGEQVELTSSDGNKQLGIVVRVEPYDANLMLVACRINRAAAH